MRGGDGAEQAALDVHGFAWSAPCGTAGMVAGEVGKLIDDKRTMQAVPLSSPVSSWALAVRSTCRL